MEDNIRIDLREIGYEGADWMHLAQDRDQWKVLVNAVLKRSTRSIFELCVCYGPW
jgi:hypothetical protein